MENDGWTRHRKRLDDGKLLVWRERTLENGEVELEYEDGRESTWTPQRIELRAA